MKRIEGIIQESGDGLILNVSGKKWLHGLCGLALGMASLLIVPSTGFLEGQPFFRGVFISAAAFSILYGLYILADSQMVMVDRRNKVLYIRSSFLGLRYHSKKVLFSQVEAVNIEYREGENYSSGGPSSYHRPDAWSVYIVFKYSKQVKVYSGENKNQQMGMASVLGEVLSKNIQNTNASPDLLERIFSEGSGDYLIKKQPSIWDH